MKLFDFTDSKDLSKPHTCNLPGRYFGICPCCKK